MLYIGGLIPSTIATSRKFRSLFRMVPEHFRSLCYLIENHTVPEQVPKSIKSTTPPLPTGNLSLPAVVIVVSSVGADDIQAPYNHLNRSLRVNRWLWAFGWFCYLAHYMTLIPNQPLLQQL